jgi:diguanylate cyclase (GGDEF)-like protein
MLQERMLELGRSTAHPHHAFGVMMLDLDHFKTLNDTHGHAAGDQLLCVVAERLQGCVRHNDMVARLGGDEFVVLLEDIDSDPTIAEARSFRLAEAILQAISQPIQLDLGNIHQSVSIGIALPAANGSSGEKLMQQADLALYESKSTGRNKARVFQEDMQQRVNALSQLETGIREGLSRGEFSIAYQLQVDASRVAVGSEALIRWSRGDGNIIAPAEFIPVAQDTGLIHKLGDLMMNQVVADLLVWETSGLLSEDFRVAINFSTPEFLHPDFAKQVISMLNTTGISGRRLRFEITEDSVLSDLAAAAERMQVLMEHEIEFSLDDFGTGYSSFAYLRYLPVGEVKIDQGFVRRFVQHPQDAAIVRAIIELGRSLGLRVVAEGVETLDQLEALQQAGCELFQGFFFDRPQLELEAHLVDRLRDLQSAAS